MKDTLFFSQLREEISAQTDAFVELMDEKMRDESAEITQKEIRYIATGVLKAMTYCEQILHAIAHATNEGNCHN